jgi:2,4'-dihydroxyacetophenone dioxygenase
MCSANDQGDAMPAPARDADAMTPYQLPNPREALREIVVDSAIPQDERL